jgi:integrase/recombinase XerD
MMSEQIETLEASGLSVVETFRKYLYQIGYSTGMQKRMARHLEEFLETINRPIVTITRQDILAFFSYLEQRPLKQKRKNEASALSTISINHYLSSLKVCFAWLEENEFIPTNPISNVEFKYIVSKARQPLSKTQIQALFEACQSLRERAVLHLFYSCGLRRMEAVSLDIKDVHFSKGILYVRQGKGAKRRAIPINKSVVADLNNYYLEERLQYKSHTKFILNEKHTPMQGSSYYKLLQKIACKAGIADNVGLHQLRHSIATHLLENGLSLEFVRDFLGHTHLETTQIYTKVSKQQLQKLIS